MTSQGPPSTARSRDEGFPAAISEAGAPSILSSQMTDISEDGREVPDTSRRPSAAGLPWGGGGHRTTPSTSSRPGTGATSGRGAWARSPPPRSAGQRTSISGIPGSKSEGMMPSRPPSSASRTHVPSLTSHAFFRPMSSQRLQAQRGGQRPTSTGPMSINGSTYSAEKRQSLNSNPPGQAPQSVGESDMGPAPPSRGTEMTDHETVDRNTANTHVSVSESMRPLQKPQAATRNLTLNLEDHSGTGSSRHEIAPPKSPGSFRSNFLNPRSRDSRTPNRSSSPGREKLSSVSSNQGTATAPPPSESALKSKPGHNYQYFTGNTVFCWGGRLQNTRHRPINIATGVLVVIPGVLFFAFSASWTWHNISPAIPIIFAYIYYISLSSFIHGSLSDPGILPRNLHAMPPPSENDDPLTLAPPTTEWTLIKSFTSATSAMELPTKYCKTCNLWRPPRGHHCRICDNCVETQDHHCVWLNNCMGRRNYRYFFTFLASTTLLGVYLFGVCLAQILVYAHINHTSVANAASHFRVPVAMMIYAILGGAYPAALTGYHLFLMGRGETTREYLNSHKFAKTDRHRAFTQKNVLRNWIAVLCRPRPPTYLNFKKSYEDGDQRFGEKRGKRTAPLAEGLEMNVVRRSQPEHGFQGPKQLLPR